MDFKFAIFDLDGTLIDSMWIWKKIIFEFLDKYECDYDIHIAEKIAHMTFTVSSAYLKNLYKLPQSCEEMMAEWISMSENYYKHIIKAKKGVYEYLNYLKENEIRLAIATSCPRYLCESVLKSVKLEQYFETVVYAEEVGKSKEEPDVYIETMKRLSADAGECMLYEDILAALNTAHSIGLRVTIVEDESAKADRAALIEKSDIYIKDFTELLHFS